MAGGSGGAAASNNAHGWMRAAQRAVLLLALQLWQCLGNVEEPALEEALGGDDQCNATGTGGTCQVEMMQLRAAMMGDCPETRGDKIWTGKENVRRGSERCLPAWFKSFEEAERYFKEQGARLELYRLAEFNAVYSFATKNGGFEHAASQVAKHEKYYAVNGIHPYVDAMVLPNLPGAYREYPSRNEHYKSYNVFWKSYYRFMVRWSKVMVFFVTKEWLESPNTLEELSWALDLFMGERIIVTWIGKEVHDRVGRVSDNWDLNSPYWIERRLLCQFGKEVVKFVKQNSLDVNSEYNPTREAVKAWLAERPKGKRGRRGANLLEEDRRPGKKGDKKKNGKDNKQCKLVEEKEKKRREEKNKKKKRRNRTAKGRRNARQKRWAADFMTNLDPGVCQKKPWEKCEDFPSREIFKVQCAGPVGRYCGESTTSCGEQHLKNLWSIAFVPANLVGWGKIRKGLKIGKKASRAVAIAAFKAAVKKAGKELFNKWKRKVREFMRPKEFFKEKLGELFTDMTMDAIMMGGALEFAETIGKKENSGEAWLQEAVEFADPTGLVEVWDTFAEQNCADTPFPDMPTEDLEYEFVAEAEDGDEEGDEEGE